MLIKHGGAPINTQRQTLLVKFNARRLQAQNFFHDRFNCPEKNLTSDGWNIN